MMVETARTVRWQAVLALLLGPLLVSQCCPVTAALELTYRPSPSDPYELWNAYVTDSGLLLLCGKVEDTRVEEGWLDRVYNLELRLEETLGLSGAGPLQFVQIDEHPSLIMTKGYLSDLCQFDEKRATKRPGETGWTDIMLASWDEGFVEIYPSDIEAGRLPTPPEEPRVVIYRVLESDPPAYLLMGRLREGGPEQTVLLILGPEHIEVMW